MLTSVRKSRGQPSGAETLGRSVFEMLFSELENALDGMQQSVEKQLQQQLAKQLQRQQQAAKKRAADDLLLQPATFIDEEEYCYQVVMLLYTIAVHGLETCSEYLSAPERVETLLAAARCPSPRIQHRSLRLLSRVLPSPAQPSMREMRSVEEDQTVVLALWDMVAEARPPALLEATAEGEARYEEDGEEPTQQGGEQDREPAEAGLVRAIGALGLQDALPLTGAGGSGAGRRRSRSAKRG